MLTKNGKGKRFLVLLPSVLFFLACLPLNGFCTEHACAEYTGAKLLAVGWLGVFYLGPSNLTWIANPLLLGSWLASGKSRIVFAFLALAIGGAFFFFDAVEVDESGVPRVIVQHGPGYWLWLLSMIYMCCAGLVSWRASPASKRAEGSAP